MSKFGTFVLGGLVGACVALLYAPRPGDQTRALVTEKVNAVWGEAKDWGAGAVSGTSAQGLFQDVAAKGQEFARGAAAQATSAAEAAASRVKEATEPTAPAYSGDSDELREKIEAARKRIAAQVMKNAEESRAAVPLDAPAVEEEAAEAVDAVAEAAAAAVDAVEEAIAE